LPRLELKTVVHFENVFLNFFLYFHLKPSSIFKAILEGYGIDASKIKIFEIENEPEMQAIQTYMGKVTGRVFQEFVQNLKSKQTMSRSMLPDMFFLISLA
jgi:hypothetical protein